MKSQLFTINRHGVFTTSKSVRNQCKSPGHTQYDYVVRVKCPTELDDNGFVIDHNEIDRVVQHAVQDINSCEKICLIISEYLMVTLVARKIKAKNIYVKVSPRLDPSQKREVEYTGNSAFMELETVL